MNPRQRMRVSNKLVKEFLLKSGHDQIWFKAHTKFIDNIYTQNGKYSAIDLWNLFDGICFDRYGDIVFLQMKTNAWAKDQPLKDFVEKYNNIRILSLNVTNKLKMCNGKYIVRVRVFDR